MLASGIGLRRDGTIGGAWKPGMGASGGKDGTKDGKGRVSRPAKEVAVEASLLPPLPPPPPQQRHASSAAPPAISARHASRGIGGELVVKDGVVTFADPERENRYLQATDKDTVAETGAAMEALANNSRYPDRYNEARGGVSSSSSSSSSSGVVGDTSSSGVVVDTSSSGVVVVVDCNANTLAKGDRIEIQWGMSEGGDEVMIL